MSARKPLIAGNWKMHGTKSQVATLINGIKHGISSVTGIDVLVLPTLLHLHEVQELLRQPLHTSTPILLGAQNLYLGTQGAFTGEVSGTMLKESGCQYVLVGHSERRSLFHEELSLVAAKCQAAVAAQLIPILCVGETQAERQQGKTEQVIKEQLYSVIELIGIEPFANIVIAYEPVWAIGTGVNATPEQAEAIHLFIRELIAKNNVDIANTIRILYGGSMKPENAATLLAMPNIDGGLIGGASLDAKHFLAICEMASKGTVKVTT